MPRDPRTNSPGLTVFPPFPALPTPPAPFLSQLFYISQGQRPQQVPFALGYIRRSRALARGPVRPHCLLLHPPISGQSWVSPSYERRVSIHTTLGKMHFLVVGAHKGRSRGTRAGFGGASAQREGPGEGPTHPCLPRALLRSSEERRCASRPRFQVFLPHVLGALVPRARGGSLLVV